MLKKDKYSFLKNVKRLKTEKDSLGIAIIEESIGVIHCQTIKSDGG